MAATPDLIERENALQGLGVSRLRKERNVALWRLHGRYGWRVG